MGFQRGDCGISLIFWHLAPLYCDLFHCLFVGFAILFVCDDIFDYLDASFLSVNQCILTSNSTWKHFGDYSGTCGECTWLHLLTID